MSTSSLANELVIRGFMVLSENDSRVLWAFGRLEECDLAVRAAMFRHIHGTSSEDLDEIRTDPKTDEQVSQMREFIKRQFRGIVHEAALQANREMAAKLEKAKLEARRNFKRRVSSEHPEGTTAELAEKYGVSKKQIRRWKAEGRI